MCGWEVQQERDPVSRTVFKQERVIASTRYSQSEMDPVDIGGHGETGGPALR